jgi:hypothetical protein
MTPWQTFHKYRRLVAANKVKPIECPDCSTPLVTLRNQKDEPYLWCPAEDTSFFPGIDLMDQIEAVVLEHYLG